MRWLAAWALTGLAACGRIGFGEHLDASSDAAIPPPPPMFVAGTRLQAERAVADGVERFNTWFDTQIGARCRFRTAADGQQRCLPDSLGINTFSDPACTVALALTFTDDLSCKTPNHATADDGRVFMLGAIVGGQRYQSQAGSCVAVGLDATFTTFALGAEVPPSTFVAGAEQSTVRVGTLSYRELVADDGARMVQPRLEDHTHGQVCDLPQADFPAAPCIDHTALPGGGTAFADAACAVPLLVVSAAATTTRAWTVRSGLCDQEERVYELGARHTTQVFEHTVAGCTAMTLDATRAAYALGPEVTAEYPRVTPYATTGPGRIGALRWRTAEGIDVQDLAFHWDHQTEAVCGPLVDEQTSASVCAPVWTTASTTVYGDATCTAGAASVVSACRTNLAAMYYPPAGGLRTTCDGFVLSPRLFDQPFAPASAYAWTGIACEPIDQIQHPLLTSNPSPTAFQAADYVPLTFVR